MTPLCCLYCLTRPGVTSVLVASVEELHAALGYVTTSEEERNYASVFSGNTNVRMTGQMHVPQPLPAVSHVHEWPVFNGMH